MISVYATCILMISLLFAYWKSKRVSIGPAGATGPNVWENGSTNRVRRSKNGLMLKVMLSDAPADVVPEATEAREMDSRSTPQSEAATKPTIEEIASSVLIENSGAQAIATLVDEATEVEETASSMVIDDSAAEAIATLIEDATEVEEIAASPLADDGAVQASEPAFQEAATLEETASSVVTSDSAVQDSALQIQEAVEEEIFPQSFPGPFAEEAPIAGTFLSFYGLSEQPFGVTPDPAYLYLSQAHREAFTSLSQGVQDLRGFMTLVAEPGMGKTTLLNKLMEELRDSARVVFLFQTQCNSRELLRYILGELGVAHAGMDLVAMHRALNEFLFQAMLEGKRFVLIVDEAQNLQDSTLETIRLLSDFETTHAKLLQIVLAGQPQLADKLTRPHLSQLRQRIAVLANLEPLDATGTTRYIEHRLGVAGSSEPLFTPDAVALIAERSQGIPRNINNICCNALLQGYAQERKTIDTDIVQKVAGKLDLESLVPQRPEQPRAAMNPAPAATANNSRQLEGPGPVQQVEAKVRGSLTGKLTELARSRPWSKDEEFKLQLLLEREPSSNLPVADRYYSCSFYVSEEQAAAFRLGQSIRIKFEQA